MCPWCFSPDTYWDLFNVGTGAISLTGNLITGNWAGALVDAGGIATDFGAAAVPGVPGGAAAAIQTTRAATNVLEAGAKQGADKVGDFFRGAKGTDAPSFTPGPNEIRVDKATGTVKPTHGVSVFDNAKSVEAKGMTPHRVDQSTVPGSLQIIQRGKDPSHFEITPKPGANLTPDQFKEALECIQCLD